MEDYDKFYDIRIYNNRTHLKLLKSNLKELGLFDSKYITVEEYDNLKYCILKYCSEVNLRNIKTKLLKFGDCTDVTIENSTINQIKLYKGSEGTITLKNCSVNKIDKKVADKIKII